MGHFLSALFTAGNYVVENTVKDRKTLYVMEEVHSTKEIIVMMWTCHLKWHALDIPHRSNSFISMCIFHLIDDFSIRVLMAFDLWWEVHLIC